MRIEERPYIVPCSFCQQGLLRPLCCETCDLPAAVCDECELVWADIGQVFSDPQSKPAAAYPECPRCQASSEWSPLGLEQLAARGLASCVADVSA